MLICHLWAGELLKDDVEIFKEGKKSQNMMLQCFNAVCLLFEDPEIKKKCLNASKSYYPHDSQLMLKNSQKYFKNLEIIILQDFFFV